MGGKDVFAQNEEALAIFRRRQVGLIYQFYNLIPVLNVTENITLPVLLDGRKVNEQRLQEMISLLVLTDAKNICQTNYPAVSAARVHRSSIDERTGCCISG